jgi:hypothetical protein
MKEYSVTVGMSEATAAALHRSGSSLQVFRVVRSSDRAARPLLWRRQDSYAVWNQITWSEGLNAYTSSTRVEAGAVVTAGFYAPVRTGDVLRVDANGVGTVTTDGDPSAVTVQNEANAYFTCGIGGDGPGAPEPFCAFPLYGGNQQAIIPTQKVMLRFSAEAIRPGTVIGGRPAGPADGAGEDRSVTSTSPGVLVDLSDKPDHEVTYDINNGWSWGGYAWARHVPAGADLVPLLIEAS